MSSRSRLDSRTPQTDGSPGFLSADEQDPPWSWPAESPELFIFTIAVTSIRSRLLAWSEDDARHTPASPPLGRAQEVQSPGRLLPQAPNHLMPGEGPFSLRKGRTPRLLPLGTSNGTAATSYAPNHRIQGSRELLTVFGKVRTLFQYAPRPTARRLRGSRRAEAGGGAG